MERREGHCGVSLGFSCFGIIRPFPRVVSCKMAPLKYVLALQESRQQLSPWHLSARISLSSDADPSQIHVRGALRYMSAISRTC